MSLLTIIVLLEIPYNLIIDNSNGFQVFFNDAMLQMCIEYNILGIMLSTYFLVYFINYEILKE